VAAVRIHNARHRDRSKAVFAESRYIGEVVVASARLLLISFIFAPTKVHAILECLLVVSEPPPPRLPFWDVAIHEASVYALVHLKPEASPGLSTALGGYPLLKSPVVTILAVAAREAMPAIATISIHLVCACTVVDARLTDAVVNVGLAVPPRVASRTVADILRRVSYVCCTSGAVSTLVPSADVGAIWDHTSQ